MGNKGPVSAPGGALLRGEGLPSPTPMPRLLARSGAGSAQGLVRFLGVQSCLGNRGCPCQNSHAGECVQGGPGTLGCLTHPVGHRAGGRRRPESVTTRLFIGDRTTRDAKCTRAPRAPVLGWLVPRVDSQAAWGFGSGPTWPVHTGPMSTRPGLGLSLVWTVRQPGGTAAGRRGQVRAQCTLLTPHPHQGPMSAPPGLPSPASCVGTRGLGAALSLLTDEETGPGEVPASPLDQSLVSLSARPLTVSPVSVSVLRLHVRALSWVPQRQHTRRPHLPPLLLKCNTTGGSCRRTSRIL